MSYTLFGTFIEACDCTVICPCWVDDDPVGGHCTGLIAWDIDGGKLNGIDIAGRRIVSVSSHSGNRRASTNTTSMLYIDHEASESQFRELTEVFSGRIGGPLKGLAAVSGVVLGSERANISVDPADDGRWQVLVHTGNPDVPVILATGEPKMFDEGPDPLTLQHTALDKELGVPAGQPAVTAQQGHNFAVNVGALPAGTLTVEGRSGMRGSFFYTFNDSGSDSDDESRG